MLPSNDSSEVMDPLQVPTGTVRVTHLHCVGHLDEAGTGLGRLSLLLRRLEAACLNFIHIIFYKQLEGVFSCDKLF